MTAGSRRTGVLDPEGHLTTTLYDALGRPYAKIDAEDRVTITVYDAAGGVLSVVDAAGNRTEKETPSEVTR